MEVYREALERWPSRVEFSRRLRLCEIHFKLHRRYSDASFRNVLLALPQDQAAELYDEVLERIQSNYVDPVPLEPLVRHGLDNLEVALRDPVFLKANAPDRRGRARRPGSARLLRQYRANLAVPDRTAAIRMAHDLQRARPAGDRPGRHARPAGIHLRRLRRPRRLHQLPDARQARRPLRHDRRQLRRPGDRAQARQGGPAAGRRDPRRTGVGGGPQAGRHDRQGRRRSRSRGWASTRPPTGSRAPRGARSSWASARRTAPCRRYRLVRRHVEVESVTKAKIVDPAAGIGYLRLIGLPEDVGRRDRRGDRRALSRRGCGSWCSTSGATRAAC